MIPVLGSPTPKPSKWYPPNPPTPQAESVRLRTLFAHEGPKTVIFREDRVPKMPDPCDSTSFGGTIHT